MSETQKSNYLLPSSVVPTHYRVELRPDLEKFTFNGSVSIDVNICESVSEIKLHAADLDIKAADVRLWLEESNFVNPSEVRLDKEGETATFVFDKEFQTGQAILEIKYAGILNERASGFYRSKYTTADGQEKHMAVTQFEATDARRALPCWDEPARKASFDVRLIVPDQLVALSNMPVKWAVPAQDVGYKVVCFDSTPIMSTYLLAFVVGEFEYVETHTKNGTLVRVYALPGKSHQGEFALDIGKGSLELYDDYFDMPYPLPKLDMIAVPDFNAGAMENWGLVTYRENALLFDATNSSIGTKQRVTEIVAHELAHQWFGNLVTMEWWTDLWLNEGFATWVANLAMDKLFSEWDIWTQFLADDVAQALSLDGLRSSHPIEVPVNHPDEIGQIFDAISYSKGASVIHMIHEFIGAEAFRNGLRVYLKRHAYGNAVTEDLWQALEEASGQPVRKMMDTWTKQAGYPLIRILKDKDKDVCVLWQDRFLASGHLTEEEEDQVWQVPLVAEFNSELDSSDNAKWENSEKPSIAKTVFSGKVRHLPNNGRTLLKLNSGQVALVRVNYLPEQWQTLSEAVADGKLAPKDRYGILSDALALTRAGHLPVGQLINLLSSYKNEDNFTVCMTVLEALGALNSVLEETLEHDQFASFARSALAPIAGKLGWEEGSDESHTTKLLREPVLLSMGKYGDKDTISEAKDRFYDHVHEVRLADPNLRKVIYGLTAQNGSRVAFDALLNLYRKETLKEEKARLLASMGRFTDQGILSAVLEFAFFSEEVRHTDFIYVLAGMGSHTSGRRVAWTFFSQNWSSVSERYSGGGLKMLGHLVSSVCDGFACAEDADAIEQFFKDNPTPSATRAIAESLERIRVRAAWYQRDKEDIKKVFKSE